MTDLDSETRNGKETDVRWIYERVLDGLDPSRESTDFGLHRSRGQNENRTELTPV